MSNHTREAEINQRFDSIESKLAALEKLIKSNPVSEAPASLQTAITCDTPINTIGEINMNASIKKMTYCTQCAHHKVMPDPNPDNQFTTDNVAILCTKTKQKPNLNSNDGIEKQDCRVVARHRSPYHLVNGFQTEIPSWCPEREGLVKEDASPNELYIFGEKGLSGQEEKVLILNMETSMRIGTYTFKAQELKKLVAFIQENLK